MGTGPAFLAVLIGLKSAVDQVSENHRLEDEAALADVQRLALAAPEQNRDFHCKLQVGNLFLAEVAPMTEADMLTR